MNNYFNPYGFSQPNQQPIQQPIQQSIQQPVQQPVQQPQFQNGGLFFFVNSKEEAEKWIVSQGQTVYLFDVNNGVFYAKTVNRNGLPQPIETFKFSKMVEEPKEEIQEIEYVSKEEFEDSMEKLKNEIKKLKPIRKKEVKKDE